MILFIAFLFGAAIGIDIKTKKRNKYKQKQEKKVKNRDFLDHLFNL